MDGYQFQPLFFPAPSQANIPSSVPLDSGVTSAAGMGISALAAPLLGPFAPLAAVIPSIGGGKGLTDAFGLGITSLFGGSKQTNNQTQASNQETNVTVSNILGGRPFGNFNAETGDFDTAQALSDIFAIKAAQDAAAGTSTPAATTPAATTKKPLNFVPIFVVGGLAAAFMLFKGGK